jgi:hypothetical protein
MSSSIMLRLKELNEVGVSHQSTSTNPLAVMSASLVTTAVRSLSISRNKRAVATKMAAWMLRVVRRRSTTAPSNG